MVSVSRIVVFLVLTIAVTLVPVATLDAEIRQSVRIEATHALTHLGDGDWGLAGIGVARLDFLSTGNQFARGQLRIDATIVDAVVGDQDVPAGVLLEVPRAWVRARFPLGDGYFHTTAGRARLTWGDGAFFNAGDILFGSVGRDVDLTSETIRDEARWLWSGYFPLGRFAFLEPILLAPDVQINPDGSGDGGVITSSGLSGGDMDTVLGAETQGIWNLSVGGRVQGQIAGIKSEVGYLYRGREQLHTVSLSAQGHRWVDLYGSASTDLTGTGRGNAAWDNLAISAGLLHIQRLSGDASLLLRIESLWRPAATWSDRRDPQARYATALFPELVWSPVQNASIFLRSIVSPVDGSALIIPGASWNIFQDFTMSLFAFVAAGDSTDLFHPNRPGGAAVKTTFSLVY